MNFFTKVKTRVFIGLFVLAFVLTTFFPVISARASFIGPQQTQNAWTVEYRVVLPEKEDQPFNGKLNTGHALIVVRKPNGKKYFTSAYWYSATGDYLKIKDYNDGLMAKGYCGSRGCVVRKARVSESRAKWVMRIAREHPDKYTPLGDNGGMNCVTYANSVWKQVTGKQEDFKEIFPEEQAEVLKRLGKYFDGGSIWF